MIRNNPELDKYKSLVFFLAEVLGNNNEVVLHDLTNLDQSIVTIQNNHISDREIGGPATDLVLKIMKTRAYTEKSYVTNYKGQSKKNKTLRSSTYFIRNEASELIGMLCINSDVSAYQNLVASVMQISEQFNFQTENTDDYGSSEHLIENLSFNIEDLTLSSIESFINAKQILPERMTQDEKIEVIDELNKKGIFLLKGAVSEVAKYLKSSEPTIYRYLKKILNP